MSPSPFNQIMLPNLFFCGETQPFLKMLPLMSFPFFPKTIPGWSNPLPQDCGLVQVGKSYREKNHNPTPPNPPNTDAKGAVWKTEQYLLWHSLSVLHSVHLMDQILLFALNNYIKQRFSQSFLMSLNLHRFPCALPLCRTVGEHLIFSQS